MGLFSGSQIKDKIRIENLVIRECLAEFLGTFILCVFAVALKAMNIVPPKLNPFLCCQIGSGLAVAMGVWCSGGVSGGHINPAVTLVFAILGRTPWLKVPFYWVGQYLGAFCGAACVFGVYYDAINDSDGGKRAVFGANATAGVFVSFPQEYMSFGGAFSSHVLDTMLLMVCIMAITNEEAVGVPRGLVPLAFAMMVACLNSTFSANCGSPMNPARDLGPRVLAAIVGYGSDCFTAYNYYFWIPIVGPHIGALCGAMVYLALVGAHIPDDKDTYEIHADHKRDELSESITSNGTNHSKHLWLNGSCQQIVNANASVERHDVAVGKPVQTGRMT